MSTDKFCIDCEVPMEADDFGDCDERCFECEEVQGLAEALSGMTNVEDIKTMIKGVFE